MYTVDNAYTHTHTHAHTHTYKHTRIHTPYSVYRIVHYTVYNLQDTHVRVSRVS